MTRLSRSTRPSLARIVLRSRWNSARTATHFTISRPASSAAPQRTCCTSSGWLGRRLSASAHINIKRENVLSATKTRQARRLRLLRGRRRPNPLHGQSALGGAAPAIATTARRPPVRPPDGRPPDEKVAARMTSGAVCFTDAPPPPVADIVRKCCHIRPGKRMSPSSTRRSPASPPGHSADARSAPSRGRRIPVRAMQKKQSGKRSANADGPDSTSRMRLLDGGRS
jgi:hypothetical protein